MREPLTAEQIRLRDERRPEAMMDLAVSLIYGAAVLIPVGFVVLGLALAFTTILGL